MSSTTGSPTWSRHGQAARPLVPLIRHKEGCSPCREDGRRQVLHRAPSWSSSPPCPSPALRG
uniref:Uncharacterized protein n=1 Tax=Oryza meridionalis TaxID=40149 RepID=A0A0E0C8X9_9ORYZ